MNTLTTAQIRTAFNLKAANSKRSRGSWETVLFMDVMDIHTKNGLNRHAGEMLYGIIWSLKTGRLTATTEMALRAMSAYKFSALLANVTAKCEVINDVPQFLNKEVN